MKEFQYTVKDACGIHARPAGLLVKTVKGFASSATLEKDGKSCDMRKLMALMGMGVKQGETVTVKVEGDDEEAAEDGPVQYEVTCPACGATSVVDEEALLDGDPVCPSCGKPLDFEVTEE